MMRRWLLALFLVPLAACADGGVAGGPTPPDSTASADSLHYLRPGPGAPPFADRVVSFWAVRGQKREVRLMYQPAAGQTDSVEFARFRVDDRSLVNGPDGTPIADGDSLLITLSLVDTLRLVVDFQPAGLVFAPSKPARLWLKFGEADPDLDGDGSVTAADTTLLQSLSIWKQELPTDPFELLPSLVNLGTEEVETDVTGFTRYAVSY